MLRLRGARAPDAKCHNEHPEHEVVRQSRFVGDVPGPPGRNNGPESEQYLDATHSRASTCAQATLSTVDFGLSAAWLATPRWQAVTEPTGAAVYRNFLWRVRH